MFYVFEEINWRWYRHNTVPLSHIRSRPTVSDSVSPARPPLNPPLSSAILAKTIISLADLLIRFGSVLHF